MRLTTCLVFKSIFAKQKNYNNKNTTCVRQGFNKIYCKNKTKTKQDYDKKKKFKTSVEHIESNVEFFLYLYPLGT